MENPLAYAHLQLRGGWRNVAFTSGSYALLIAVIILITLRINPLRVQAMLSGWTMLLGALQIIFLLVLGCSGINGAVRTDLTSNMLESHRLMPVPPSLAIFGYLTGPTVHALAFAAATFFLGSLTTAGAGLPFARWAIPNLILLLFCIFIWVLAVFIGLCFKNGFRWLSGLAVLVFFARGSLLSLLPGLMLLCTPLVGSTILGGRSPGQITWIHGAAILAQFAIGAILYAGAARRYRRADIPALGVLLGLLLLASWVAVSGISSMYWEEVAPHFLRNTTLSGNLRLIATLCSAMLLACIPIAAACLAEGEYLYLRRIHGNVLAPRPAPPLLITLLAAALCLAICFTGELSAPRFRLALLHTAIAVAAFLVALQFLVRILARRRAKVLVLAGVFWLLLWLGPLVADLIRRGLADVEPDEVFGPISAASPLGLFIHVWTATTTNPAWGLGFQVFLAITLAALFYGARRDPDRGPLRGLSAAQYNPPQ